MINQQLGGFVQQSSAEQDYQRYMNQMRNEAMAQMQRAMWVGCDPAAPTEKTFRSNKKLLLT